MVNRVMARRAFRMRWQLFYTTRHAQTFQPHTIRKLDLDGLQPLVPAGRVEGHAGKRGHQLTGVESRRPRLFLGTVDDHPADPPSRVSGIDEHRPDPRRLGGRIEPAVDRGLPGRSGEELLPFAPAPTGHDR